MSPEYPHHILCPATTRSQTYLPGYPCSHAVYSYCWWQILFSFFYFWYFHFDGIESFSEDTDDTTLTDKGVGVYRLDESEDIDTLSFLGQDTEYPHSLAGVPSVSVEDGDTMVHLCTDGIGYLLIFLAEYHKLYRLSAGVHHTVENVILYHHRSQTEHHLAPVAENRNGTADDDQIDKDEYTAEGYVVILVDDGCHDIRTTCTTVVEEHDSQGRTGHRTTDDERHEVLSGTQYLHHLAVGTDHVFLSGPEQYRQYQNGIDGLYHKLESQYFQSDENQHQVDDEVTVLNRDLGSIEYDGCDTGHTSCYNLVGQQEHGPTECIQHEAKGYHQIIPDLIP